MADTVERAIYELSVRGQEQLNQADQALGRIAVTEERVTRATRTTIDGLERMIATIDKRARAEQQLQRSLEQIRRYEQEGVGSAERRAKAVELVTQRYQGQISAINQATTAVNDNSKGMLSAETSARRMQGAMTNLSFQVNDVVQGLISGQDPLRILAQQGGQIVQVFQQAPGGVSGTLSAAAAAIRSMITPTTAAIAGIVALGAGIGVLAARASDANQSVRVFNVLLRGLGDTGTTSAAELEAAAKRLRDVGLSAAEARQQIAGVARTGISPAFAEQIVRTGRNLSAAFGGDQTQDLTRAFSSGLKSAVEYGLQVRALTVEEAANRLEMGRHGQAGQALALVFQSITRHAKDLERDALSPAAKAFRDMRVAWSEALDTLSNSGPIQIVVGALEQMAKTISAIAKGMADIKAIAAGAAVGAAGGAALGSVVPGVGTAAGAVIGGAVGAFAGAAESAANNPTFYGNIPPRSVAGLQPELQIGLRDLIARAAEDGIVIGVGSGLRSTQRQAQLYAQDIARNGGVASGMVAPPGRSQHEVGGAADLVDANGRLIRAGSPEAAWLARNIGQFGLTRPMSFEPWHVEPVGGRAGGILPDNRTNIAAADEAVRTAQRQADATRGVGLANDELRAKLDAEQMALEKNLDAGGKARVEAGLRAAAVARLTNEIANETAATSKEIDGARSVAEAYRQSYGEGKIQEAVIKAQTEAFRRFGETSSEAAQKFEADRGREIIALDKWSQSNRNAQDALAQRDTQEQLQLQIALVGQLPEIAQRELTLLQAKQQIQREFPFLSEQEKTARLATVQATADLNLKLQEAQRSQSRLEDGIRGIATTIENELTRSIEDAFSGKKVDDWGTRIKRMLGSLVSQISDALFIKPLLGSIAGALGFGNVASSFGTFGGGGLLGGLFGGSSTGTPTLTGTVGGQPATFSLSNVSSGLSIGKSLFGGEGGFFGDLFGGSGGSSFFSNIGRSLGFAQSVPGLSQSSINSLGSLIGIEPSSLGYLGNSFTIPGSAFGNLTLGSAFSSIGAGFGAGSLLNSILGGDKLLGSIGSGIGSLAGTLLPSVLGFSLGPLGGILGGALGGLFGLFGNTKPRNQSAGGDIDFATGRITGTFTGGNSQIDQATLGAVKDISAFTKDLLRVSGGALSGNVLLQNGVNTGFTADSTLPGYTGRFSLGKDATAAVETVELALARSLTNISDTMKTVINSVTDPALLRDAIEFAAEYDDIKTAFDSAFSSIAQDTKTLGPFGQALDLIDDKVADLTDKANEYGLSLEPITAALDEATKRLKSDYRLSLEQQVAGSSQFLTDALSAHQQVVQNWNDAVRLGLDDAATSLKVNRIESQQLGAALGALDLRSLQKAVEVFADTAPEVSSFAQALIDAGQYLPSEIEQLTLAITDPVTLAIEKERLAGEQRIRIAQATGEDIIAINKYNQLALDEIWKQATGNLQDLRDNLTTGDLSGKTVAAQIEAANDEFRETLSLVNSGNLAKIDSLTSIAQNLIDLAIDAYGNAPKTADIRADILSAIDPILAKTPGFASGTRATPPGTILVGERGPELISQQGGLRVWSNPETERILSAMPGRHFADGTLFNPRPAANQNGPFSEAIEAKLDQLIALLEGNNTIAREHGAVAQRGFARVAGAIEDGNAPAFEAPARRRA